MHRRQFAQGVALIASGAALSAVAGLPAAKSSWRAAGLPEDLSLEFFRSMIGQSFSLSRDGSRAVKLRSVERLAAHVPGEQFNLVFELDTGPLLRDGIHRLDGIDVGSFELYLAHEDFIGSRQRLVATVNRLPLG